jgi:hypothetical protein
MENSIGGISWQFSRKRISNRMDRINRGSMVQARFIESLFEIAA